MHKQMRSFDSSFAADTALMFTTRMHVEFFKCYRFAAVEVRARIFGAASASGRGEATAKEKSMMYLTVFGQNRQGVSWIFCRSSVVTLKGNDRRQSVQVSTT